MKSKLYILFLIVSIFCIKAQNNDTLFVMKSGYILFRIPADKVDSITFENYFLNRPSAINEIASKPNYSIFYQALAQTGLADSLLKDRDKTYRYSDFKYLITTTQAMNQWFYEKVPGLRRFGYTVLMESDSVFHLQNINSLSDLKQYAASVYNQVYPEDAGITDVTNRKNSLNRFIAYHLIDKKLSPAMFIDKYDTNHMIKTVDMYEYISTMCPNTLIEIKKERDTNRTNLINKLNGSGKVIKIAKHLTLNQNLNTEIYEIDNILTYNANFAAELSGKRLRFDIASFFPELTNNGMRGESFEQNTNTTKYSEQSVNYIIPPNYISGIKTSLDTKIIYLCGYHKFQNYMGDELDFTANSGKLYDFEIETPPIPAGTYEIRYGYLCNGNRGIAQYFIDGIPTGIPINLNNSSTQIGWEKPGSIAYDPMGYRNDKDLRNHGYMKGPANYKVITEGWTSGANARYSNAILRKILGTFTFNNDNKHIIKISGLASGQFQFDFIEFVPVNCIENEDIY